MEGGVPESLHKVDERLAEDEARSMSTYGKTYGKGFHRGSYMDLLGPVSEKDAKRLTGKASHWREAYGKGVSLEGSLGKAYGKAGPLWHVFTESCVPSQRRMMRGLREGCATGKPFIYAGL